MDRQTVLTTLNRVMELELAGVVRYTHYALMVYGYNRIPDRRLAARRMPTKSLIHARLAGELVTWLGGHPSLSIGPLLESHKHDIGDILVRVARARSRIAQRIPRVARPGEGRGRATRGVRARHDRRGGRAPGRGQQDAAPARADGRLRALSAVRREVGGEGRGPPPTPRACLYSCSWRTGFSTSIPTAG